MKDVENVTGRMGEGEAMAPAEEAASVAGMPLALPVEASAAGESAVAVDTVSTAEVPAPEAAAPALREQAGADPWAVLLQAGIHLASALSTAGDAEAAPHPWIERDAAGAARSLRLPLPSPQTARRLADALAAFAESLRGAGARG
jgi:hypothetical protein